MKEFEPNYIEKLIDIMKDNELTEVTLEDDKKLIVIKTGDYKPVIKESVKSEVIAEEIQAQSLSDTCEEKRELVPIVSNMIGIYYAAPKPNEPPFVTIGSEIKEGQTVCIIETIKLVNKITSDTAGKVAQICIEDGKPVEYGQVIMYIEKN